MEKMSYEAPLVEVFEVEVEQGFASSGPKFNGFGSEDEWLD